MYTHKYLFFLHHMYVCNLVHCQQWTSLSLHVLTAAGESFRIWKFESPLTHSLSALLQKAESRKQRRERMAAGWIWRAGHLLTHQRSFSSSSSSPHLAKRFLHLSPHRKQLLLSDSSKVRPILLPPLHFVIFPLSRSIQKFVVVLLLSMIPKSYFVCKNPNTDL